MYNKVRSVLYNDSVLIRRILSLKYVSRLNYHYYLARNIECNNAHKRQSVENDLEISLAFDSRKYYAGTFSQIAPKRNNIIS